MRNSLIETCIARDLGFTEGPLWTLRGTLMVVGLSRGVVYEMDGKTGTTVAQFHVGGHPNGLTEDASGDIWVTQAGHSDTPASLQRIRGGDVEAITGDFDGPNDLAFGPDGMLWFTDPRGNPMEGAPDRGRIWTFDPASEAFALKSSDAWYPNGLAFAPQGDALYVAETSMQRIVRYAIRAGELRSPEAFATLPDGRPDGIAFDAAGNLFVAATAAGSVQVFSPAGDLVEELTLPTGGFPTNVCFGGRDLKTLYVTSPRGGCIFAIEREIAGLPLLGTSRP